MNAMRLTTWLILMILACSVATIPTAGGDDAADGKKPAFTPAGGFNWQRTIGRRPVFTVDYWPGVPGIAKEGRPDMSSDLEHLKAYADPVTVRTLRGGYGADAASPNDPGRTGAFVMPDVLAIGDAEETDVEAQIAGGTWKDDQIGWYVVEIGKRRVAEGKGRQIRFHASPGQRYYLTAVAADHPYQDRCPLCRDHAFE